MRIRNPFARSNTHQRRSTSLPLVEPLEVRQLLSGSAAVDTTGSSAVIVSSSGNHHKRHKHPHRRHRGSSVVVSGSDTIVGTFTGNFFANRSAGIAAGASSGAQLVIDSQSLSGSVAGTLTLDSLGSSDISGVDTNNHLTFALTGRGTTGTFSGHVIHGGDTIVGTLFTNTTDGFAQGKLVLDRVFVSTGTLNNATTTNSAVSTSRAKRRNTALINARNRNRQLQSRTDPIIGSVALGNNGGQAFARDFLGTGLGVNFPVSTGFEVNFPADTTFSTRPITTTNFAFEPVTAGAFSPVTAGVF